jgi:ABC-type microcin C transport system duplicated ATPase subunit YejF
MSSDGCRPIADDNDTSRGPDILDIQINLPFIELLRDLQAAQALSYIFNSRNLASAYCWIA